MKARTARSSRQARPHLWSALLSLLVSLSLLSPPSQICELIESAPGHSHHEHHPHDLHESAGGHRDGHSRAQHAHLDASRLAPAPVETSDSCCGHSEAIPFVAASAPRLPAPHESPVPAAYAPAVLPQAQDIFALCNCHGRDGPPSKALRSQLVPPSLLGRAPPLSA